MTQPKKTLSQSQDRLLYLPFGQSHLISCVIGYEIYLLNTYILQIMCEFSCDVILDNTFIMRKTYRVQIQSEVV